MTRKQTSAKVSRLAARYISVSDVDLILMMEDDQGTLLSHIRTLAASCLSQDEVKGDEPFSTVPLSTFTKAERAKLLAGEVLIKTKKPRKAKP